MIRSLEARGTILNMETGGACERKQRLILEQIDEGRIKVVRVFRTRSEFHLTDLRPNQKYRLKLGKECKYEGSLGFTTGKKDLTGLELPVRLK
jgi:hypothetical protein